MMPNILCADWGKHPAKRRAWRLSGACNRIEPASIRGDLTFRTLLDYAEQQDGPVLLGIDAAIGVPQHTVERFRQQVRYPKASFFDWIQWLFDQGDPDTPCRTPDEWRPGRPFIAIPPGKGTKVAFPNCGIDLHRAIDQGLAANSPLIVSGIPGTVGSGSRELWREMAAALDDRPTLAQQIWPFGGLLSTLLKDHPAVICEIYPKACYGIALSSSLPARLESIAKTQERARSQAINRLLAALPKGMTIDKVERCHASEDDFDAMISVVALYKLLAANTMKTEKAVAENIEGDILGRLAVRR